MAKLVNMRGLQVRAPTRLTDFVTHSCTGAPLADPAVRRPLLPTFGTAQTRNMRRSV